MIDLIEKVQGGKMMTSIYEIDHVSKLYKKGKVQANHNIHFEGKNVLKQTKTNR
jgi:hypothetical protein